MDIIYYVILCILYMNPNKVVFLIPWKISYLTMLDWWSYLHLHCFVFQHFCLATTRTKCLQNNIVSKTITHSSFARFDSLASITYGIVLEGQLETSLITNKVLTLIQLEKGISCRHTCLILWQYYSNLAHPWMSMPFCSSLNVNFPDVIPSTATTVHLYLNNRR